MLPISQHVRSANTSRNLNAYEKLGADNENMPHLILNVAHIASFLPVHTLVYV